MDQFVRNLDAFTRALGVANAPMILSFATIPWADDDTRDDFIKDLTNSSMSDKDIYG